MKIDWGALVVVAGVSVAATLAFVVLIATGIRLLSTGVRGGTRGGAQRNGNTLALRTGQLCVVLAGALVLFCIWLIVPQFH